MIDKLRDKDYNILVINALSGSFPLRLRKKYPRARIICAEVFPYFTDHLRKLGFEVVMYKDLDARMKFDSVIGNPPYQNGDNSNFYVDFIKMSREYVAEGGRFDFIIPNRFLMPGSRSSEAMRDWVEPDYVFPNVNHHFPGISTAIGAIGGTKVSKKSVLFGKTIPYEFGNVDNRTVLNRRLSQLCPVQDIDPTTVTIVDKFLGHDMTTMVRSAEPPPHPYIYVSMMYKRYCPTKPKGGTLGINTYVNENDGQNGFYVACTSDAQAHLNSWFISRSELGRFIAMIFASGPHVSGPLSKGCMPMLPTEIAGVAVMPDDTALYRMFDITDDQVSYIRERLKPKSSK